MMNNLVAKTDSADTIKRDNIKFNDDIDSAVAAIMQLDRLITAIGNQFNFSQIS